MFSKILNHFVLSGIILLFIATQLVAGEFPEAKYGRVVHSDVENLTIVLNHDIDDITSDTNFSTYYVIRGDALNVKEGNYIRGNILPYGDGYRMENIFIVDKANDNIMTSINKQLHQDTLIRGIKAFRTVDEHIPEFALFNQDGRVLQSREFRNKFIILNFIFTRCQDQKMCPAATRKMATLQKEAVNTGIEDLQLVSITIDPLYDTPGILKEYVENYDIDTSNFSILTGPASVIYDLSKQFGIIYMKDDGTIKHNMSTVLVDKKGKIIHRENRSIWKVEEFLKRIRDA